MKRVFWGIEAVLALVLVLLLANYISNESMINKYNHQIYKENMLSFLGFYQPYIADYNLGNIYYQRGEYTKANTAYTNARKHRPSGEYDCKVRINEVLSMLQPIDEDTVTIENYDLSIDTLQRAQTILCENGCAEENGNGHNKDAQQLKEDIDAMIYRLGVKVSFVKTDENEEPLTGALLQVLDDTGKVMYEWTSDGNPHEEIRFCIDKSYVYHEEKAPEGYSKAKDITFTIDESGTVVYEAETQEQWPKNTVVMINHKTDSEGGGSGKDNKDDPKDAKPEEGKNSQTSKDDEMRKKFEDLQTKGQEERNKEIDDNKFDYEYYDGATW